MDLPRDVAKTVMKIRPNHLQNVFQYKLSKWAPDASKPNRMQTTAYQTESSFYNIYNITTVSFHIPTAHKLYAYKGFPNNARLDK